MRKLGALIAGLFCVSLILVLRKPEEQRIIERLDYCLEQAAVRSEPESRFEQVGKSRQFAGCFAHPLSIDFQTAGYEKHTFDKQDALQQKIFQGRAALSRLEPALSRPAVRVRGKAEAEVELDGSVLGSLRGEEGQFFEHRRLQLRLRKVDDEWLISEVVHLRNLRE